MVSVVLKVTAEVVAAQSTWGTGSSDDVCAQIASAVGSPLRITLDEAEQLRMSSFTVCDFEGLQVASSGPEPTAFSALLWRNHSNGRLAGASTSLEIQWRERAIYDVLMNVSTVGHYLVELRLEGELIGSSYSRGALLVQVSCPSYLTPLPDGTCHCELGTIRVPNERRCSPCPMRTSSVVGGKQCDACASGFYRVPSQSESLRCEECPHGAVCPHNSSLESILLLDGFWRLSPYSTDITMCAGINGSACLGGASGPQCAAGHTGVLCASCSETSSHFEPHAGVCLECPDASAHALGGACTLLAALVLLGLYLRPPAGLQWLSWQLHLVSELAHSIGLWSKLRITLVFFQCVAAAPSIYLLRTGYDESTRLYSWVIFDWQAVLLPADCLGAFHKRMLLSALVPLVAMLLLVGARLAAGCLRAEPISHSAVGAIHPCLLITFILTPSVSQIIFGAWDCFPVEWSSDERVYFLRAQPSIRCERTDGEYSSIVQSALVLALIWPAGSVVLFIVLASRARRRLLTHTTDRFVRSLWLLLDDFRPSAYLWASAELLTRCFLTGWVLLIPNEKSFLRLILAVLVSIASLLATMLCSPYRRREGNLLAVLSLFLLLVTYLISLFIKLLEELARHAEPDEFHAVYSQGIGSSGEEGALLLLLVFIMLLVLLLSVAWPLRNERWLRPLLLVASGLPPVLSLAPEHRWMMYLSHSYNGTE